jgi:hypothetical protein
MDPDAKLPFDNVATVRTLSACPDNVYTNDPVLGFHTLTVLSSEHDTKLPFNNRANENIQFV